MSISLEQTGTCCILSICFFIVQYILKFTEQSRFKTKISVVWKVRKDFAFFFPGLEWLLQASRAVQNLVSNVAKSLGNMIGIFYQMKLSFVAAGMWRTHEQEHMISQGCPSAFLVRPVIFFTVLSTCMFLSHSLCTDIFVVQVSHKSIGKPNFTLQVDCFHITIVTSPWYWAA